MRNCCSDDGAVMLAQSIRRAERGFDIVRSNIDLTNTLAQANDWERQRLFDSGRILALTILNRILLVIG